MRALVFALAIVGCQPEPAPDCAEQERELHRTVAAAAEAVAAAREALAGGAQGADYEGAREALDDAADVLRRGGASAAPEDR